MPKSLVSLRAEADVLGIKYDPATTATALQELIAAHQVPPGEENPPEQPQNPPEKTFSKDEVQMMIQQAIRSVRESDANMDKPEEHSKELKTARLPRFQNKFVIGLKDMNTDIYSTDPLYTTDIWDERIRQNVPWVTLQFIDDTEMLTPYKTAIEKSIKVSCEIVRVITKDASYKTGEINKIDENGQDKGETVQGINRVTEYRWELKIPGITETVEVGPTVINW